MNVFFIGKIDKKNLLDLLVAFCFSFLLQLSQGTANQEVSVYGIFCRFPKEKLSLLVLPSKEVSDKGQPQNCAIQAQVQ